MSTAKVVHVCLVLMLIASSVLAQPGHPIVTLTVELNGEKPRELTARESGLATFKTKSGVEYGFRPTIQSSKPWTDVVVTIFKMDPTTEAVGQVELKAGGPAVTSKTKPAFKIAITKVVEPPQEKTSSNRLP